VDRFRSCGLKIFGPRRQEALLGSKVYAKDLMRRAGIPTASHRLLVAADEAEKELAGASYLVLKADGLAAGKEW
jgi:phosphoribosylamine--glycine ligase